MVFSSGSALGLVAPLKSFPAKLLAASPGESELFETRHDQHPFSFHHTAHERFADFFSLQGLREAAVRVGRNRGPFYVESGTPGPGAKWGTSPGAKQPGSLSDALEQVADNSYWVVLTRLNRDPEYAPIMDQILDALSGLVGYQVLDRYYDPILTVLVTSPNRVTPCHVDYDTNLLLQIQGSKEISIFDGDDADVFPEEARERFWNGDTQAFVWKPELQDHAMQVLLAPGAAVHVPAACPHWLQNGPEISISVSINVKRRVDIVADTYKLNARLRRAGFSPTAPGKSQLHDRAMSLAWRGASGIVHLLHPRDPAA